MEAIVAGVPVAELVLCTVVPVVRVDEQAGEPVDQNVIGFVRGAPGVP
jgi:hypothetical protein